MTWVVLAAGALALAVLGRGLASILRGRSAVREPGAAAEDRMLASLRVAAGVRLLNAGLVLLVLAAVAAFTLR